MPGHTAQTHQESRFAAAVDVHQPNDDELRSGVLTLFTCGNKCAVISEDGRKGNRESRLSHARMQMVTGRFACRICSMSGELDIRMPNKKKCEGTHLEATEGGTSQDVERMWPSEGHEPGREKVRERKRVSDRRHL